MIDHGAAAKKLAREHWGYIEATLTVHGVQPEELAVIGHHYTTAMIHGIGHGIEMERRGDFRPRIGAPLSAQEVDDITASIPSGCQNWECAHHAPACPCNCQLYGMAGPGFCQFYLNPDDAEESGETLAPPSATIEEVCGILADRAAGEVLNLSLPSIALECTPSQAWFKYVDECREFMAEPTDSWPQIIEAWDCCQSMQTYRERESGCNIRLPEKKLSEMYDRGLPVMEAKAVMLVKNAAREYYAPEVNAAILSSNGHSWTVKGA